MGRGMKSSRGCASTCAKYENAARQFPRTDQPASAQALQRRSAESFVPGSTNEAFPQNDEAYTDCQKPCRWKLLCRSRAVPSHDDVVRICIRGTVTSSKQMVSVNNCVLVSIRYLVGMAVISRSIPMLVSQLGATNARPSTVKTSASTFGSGLLVNSKLFA